MEGELLSLPQSIVPGKIRVLFQEITNGFIRTWPIRRQNRTPVYVGVLNNDVGPGVYEIFIRIEFCEHMLFAMVGVQDHEPTTLGQDLPDLMQQRGID